MTADDLPDGDDRYCLLRLSAGDEKSFNLIFQKYRNRLFTYLFKVTKSRESSEEIVLDIFLKLWSGREAVVEIKDLEAFLLRVAHNKAIDFFRSVKRNPEQQHELWERMSEAVAYETTDSRVIARDIEGAIEAAVGRLSSQRRQVYYLRTYEGLSYGDIAEKMNLSSHTVRNHLAASLQFIRKFLAKSDFLLSPYRLPFF